MRALMQDAGVASAGARDLGRRSFSISPVLLLWLVTGLSVNLVSLLAASPTFAQTGIAVAGLAHCALAFWRDGGPRISVPGVYFFSAALFVFFPGLYVTLNEVTFEHGPMAVLLALNFWYFSQLLMYHLVWERRVTAQPLPRAAADPGVLRWGRWCGAVLVAVGTAASIAGAGDPGITSGAAFTGVVLLAAATFARPARISILAYAVVGAAALVYAQFVFTGFGRLQLGALGLGVAMCLAPRWRGRRVKAALMIGTVPGLLYLAQIRVAFTSEVAGASIAARSSGLESVYGPFVRFAELAHIEFSPDSLDYTYLHTFWASLVAVVPREIWPSKPIGFGAELAMLFRPELAGSGHSELALLSGEFIFAAGALGLAVLPLVLAWSLAALDRLAAGQRWVDLGTRRGLLGFVAVVILSASVADLIWGGTFSYSSRVAARLLVVLALVVLFGWRQRPSGERRST